MIYTPPSFPVDNMLTRLPLLCQRCKKVATVIYIWLEQIEVKAQTYIALNNNSNYEQRVPVSNILESRCVLTPYCQECENVAGTGLPSYVLRAPLTKENTEAIQKNTKIVKVHPLESKRKMRNL